MKDSFESRIAKLRLPPDAFSRSNEEPDIDFYAKDRFVSHLDSTALSTVESIIGSLIIEREPVILDLMASWDSHIPKTIDAQKVVGLGLNWNELYKNPSLTEFMIHDLNVQPQLPFDESSFEVVINTVSVDYLTRPFEVFAEVGRILKPGGLFLVIFSDRMFPEKGTRVWQQSTEQERVWLVEDFFNVTKAFKKPEVFISKGLPRPDDDRYANKGIPSDPIWAIYADKKGGRVEKRPRPKIDAAHMHRISGEELKKRKREVRQTLRCPHCDQLLKKWEVPQTPFTEWDSEFVYVCFNNRCPYLVDSWETMAEQGNPGFSYRLVYIPERDICTAAPIPPTQGYRESIVMDRG